MSGSIFNLVSDYGLAGDQPEAVERLARGYADGDARTRQTLEGVTGSGKTFTMANVIQRMSMPTLVISHNKTLAAQLFGELKSFFPDNAVEYFVSYYDYYQPEAYIPQTDTYIAKDCAINDEIERYRLSAMNSLMMRKDVIVVASVSCIYGLGSPEDYRDMTVQVSPGDAADRDSLIAKMVDIQYARNDYSPEPGTFRVRGDVMDVFPAYAGGLAFRIEFFGDEVDSVAEIDPLTAKFRRKLERAVISPAKQFVMPADKMEAAFARIRAELDEREAWFESNRKLIEAQRIRQRTEYDLEMMKEIGYCQGIENYSRHLAGRPAGSAGECLMDYFPREFFTVIDESHATIPQLRAMYNGDQSRKQMLVDYGFRLPSAKDNRPLEFHEFDARIGRVLYASATPSPYERSVSAQVVQQLLRPTGLLDPPVEVRPLKMQIDDLIAEVRKCAEHGERALVTTLTKRTAEDLSKYLRETGIRVEYLHSDIDAIDRVQILARLRKGEFDCLVGINLLREGLDLPEVALVAILDADKEGFLRSSTSLIQTAGRAARHVNGRVIMYADSVTDSMRGMLELTEMRRARQMAFNEEHGITPQSARRAIVEGEAVRHAEAEDVTRRVAESGGDGDFDLYTAIQSLEEEMLEAANALEFERAGALRDEIAELKRQRDGVDGVAANAEKEGESLNYAEASGAKKKGSRKKAGAGRKGG